MEDRLILNILPRYEIPKAEIFFLPSKRVLVTLSMIWNLNVLGLMPKNVLLMESALPVRESVEPSPKTTK